MRQSVLGQSRTATPLAILERGLRKFAELPRMRRVRRGIKGVEQGRDV